MTSLGDRNLSFLSDVDGCVADLVGGLRKFSNERYGLDFDPNDVVYHNDMGRSPKLADLNEELKRWFPGEGSEAGFGGMFSCFMRDANVYGRYVDPVPGAVDAMAELRTKFHVVFVTALMKRARDHFRSKMEWLERWFPDMPIITCPSEEKFRVAGTIAVDDRYDTCFKWINSDNVKDVFLFKQPWNELPEKPIGWRGMEWDEIVENAMEW